MLCLSHVITRLSQVNVDCDATIRVQDLCTDQPIIESDPANFFKPNHLADALPHVLDMSILIHTLIRVAVFIVHI
jgi:hypothetical protein